MGSKSPGVGSVSRFETTSPVTFDNLAHFTPNVELIGTTLDQFQTEFDNAQNAISELNFKNLKQDAQIATRLRQDERELVDTFTDAYMKDIGTGRSTMLTGLRNLHRDYKPGGIRYQINKNYETRANWLKEETARVGKDITAEQLRAGLAYYDKLYKGVTPSSVGLHGEYETEAIAKYTDADKIAEELAKGYMTDMISKGEWKKSSDGFLRKGSESHEYVTYEDIMQGVIPALARNKELMNYVQQYDRFTGVSNDYNDLGHYEGEGDKAKFIYNAKNPFVHVGHRVADKFAYDKWIFDQDIRDNPFAFAQFKHRLDQQEIEKINQERLSTLIGARGAKKLALPKDLADLSGLMKTAKDASTQIKRALELGRDTDGRAFTQDEIAQMYRALNNYDAQYVNFAILKKQVEDKVTPTQLIRYREAEKVMAKNLERYFKDPAKLGKLRQLIKEGTPTATALAATYGERWDLSTTQEGRKALGNYYDGVSQLADLETMNAKNVDLYIQQNYLKNDYNPVYIQTAEAFKNYFGTEGQGGKRPIGLAKAEAMLQSSPGAFTWFDPISGKFHSGTAAMSKLAQDHPGKKLDYSKMHIEAISSDLEGTEDAKSFGTSRVGAVTIPYKDANGNEGKIQVEVGFNDKTSNLFELIVEDINTFGDEKSKQELSEMLANSSDIGKNMANFKQQNSQTLVAVPLYVGRGVRIPLTVEKIIPKGTVEKEFGEQIEGYGGNIADHAYRINIPGSDPIEITSYDATVSALKNLEYLGQLSNQMNEKEYSDFLLSKGNSKEALPSYLQQYSAFKKATQNVYKKN